MPRLTKAQQRETTQVYYGINLSTCDVELVFLHRDGSLTNHSASPSTHYVFGGRAVETEILLVWHLGHLISFPPGMEQQPWTKEEITNLRAKAAQMKLEKTQAVHLRADEGPNSKSE